MCRNIGTVNLLVIIPLIFLAIAGSIAVLSKVLNWGKVRRCAESALKKITMDDCMFFFHENFILWCVVV